VKRAGLALASVLCVALLLSTVGCSDLTGTSASLPPGTGGASTTGTGETSAGGAIETTSVANGSWTRLSPTGTLPPAAVGQTMVFVGSSGKALVFGGYYAGSLLGDTWAYDAAANAWAQVRPNPDSPLPRQNCAMAYDSEGRQVILFGGWDGASELDDTWTFEPKFDAWIHLEPAGELPPARDGAAMAYDEVTRKAYMFGGWDGTDLFNDLWAYDPADNTWTRLEPPGTLPVKRMWHTLVYDPGSRRVILFGGYGGTSGSTGANLDDLWAYDPAVKEWIELARVGERPLARQGHALLLDPASGDLLLFGGCDGLTGLDDMWGYDPSANSWNQSVPTGDVPEGRDGHAMTYDSVGRTIILFGGYDFTGNFDFNDTWAYGVGPGEDSP